MNEYTFTLINPFHAQQYWKQCEPLLTSVIEKTGLRPKMDEHHIWAWILQGSMHLWLAVTPDDEVIAMGVTETVTYPKCIMLNNFIAAVKPGIDYFSIDDAHATWEEWARQTGHNLLQSSGRLGWKKFLLDKGYVSPMLTTTKVLTNERFH